MFRRLTQRLPPRRRKLEPKQGDCGKTEELDEALCRFAEAYGDQTERGHAALVKAIKVGKVAAAEGV